MEKLQELLQLQSELVQKYIKVYNLPPIPLEIDNPQHQDTFRHLVSSTLEELSEIFIAFEDVHQIVINDPNPESGAILQKLKNLNHELADALHFFLEILMYSNISWDSIKGYTEHFAKSHNLVEVIDPLPVLDRLFFIVKELRARNGYKENKPHVLLREIPEIYSGAKNIATHSVDAIPLMLWDISHNLHIAQHELKNKVWKQTRVPTNVKEFQKGVLVSFLDFINLLSTLSHTPLSIYLLYKEKNEINQSRINSKY